jgi:predicted dehydrogenase
VTNAIRVGVIGTGFGARVVAPVFQQTDACDVVDVVSARDPSAVAELCRRDLDLVSVHSPPFLHAVHVRAAVGAGHHVLCDKPFGVHAGEAAEMLELADTGEVVHALNFEFRHQPARRRVHELVHSGAIGRVDTCNGPIRARCSAVRCGSTAGSSTAPAAEGGSGRGAPTRSTRSGGWWAKCETRPPGAG